VLDCAWHDVETGVERVDGVLVGANVPGEQGVHVRSAVLVAGAL